MALTISPNMLLPVPSVGTQSGPQYAQNINDCLSIIDQHDHSPGSGVPVTSTGLNINSDLSINDNNLVSLRSTRYTSQATPLALASDLTCVYVSGGELYYNDAASNQVQLTLNGGVAGSPGSISNLTSPASASYVSADKTFVWQSDVNTPANMDGGSYILRNITASSKGLTLAPPNAMAADYTITLPALPGTTNIVTLTSSGALAATLNVDNSTLIQTGNSLAMAPNTVVNRAYAQVVTAPTISTAIPVDDTIPQISEGTQVLTCSITPKYASSILRIRTQVPFSCSLAGAQVIALFRDLTASAIAARLQTTSIDDDSNIASLEIEVAASAAVSTTFKIRMGTDSGVITVNGIGGNRRLGGVSAATLIIEEIKQ